MAVDYSLYLVTGRDLLPPGKDYLESIEEALQGGVTVVQVREKTADTGEFLEIARATQTICKRYGVPIFINDRIDIALAINADGVHLGQTDMPIAIARQLLPPGIFIGVSCNTVEHVQKAIANGADYVGIGGVYGTATKKLTEPTLGPRGVGQLLRALEGSEVKAVAIAGINHTNILRTLHGAVSPGNRTLDGVAIVSDIIASHDPRAASQRLASAVRAFKGLDLTLGSGVRGHHVLASYDAMSVVKSAAALLDVVRAQAPLVHQITNNVVINQSANVTLALGASPIMATSPPEMGDLGKIPGGLLINFGTIADKAGMLAAGHHANLNGKPIVFDPVGVGATAHRRTTASELLNTWQAAVIKGNAAEIGALANSTEVAAKGVDSTGSGFADPASVIKKLALQERCIVVLTGKIDYITDGHTVLKLANGHPLLADITGSGCIVGTAVATFCGAGSMAARASPETEENSGRLYLGDALLGAVGGVLAITVASELAGLRPEVRGPGTFLPALIDELARLSPETLIERAKLEVLTE